MLYFTLGNVEDMNPTNPMETGTNPENYVPLERSKAEYAPPLGHTALDRGGTTETEAKPFRLIEVEGRTVETDLPEGVDIVLVGFSPKRPSVPIKEVNKLPAGKFMMFDRDNKSFTRGGISLTEHDGFKRINHSETSVPVFGLRRIGEGASGLMEQLGFVVSPEGKWASESPTPDTFRSKAAALGVDVRFFPDFNLVPAHEYLDTFKNGQYPVALGSGEYYAHDTSDDHITAMVFGGEELKDTLAAAAIRALETGDDALVSDAAAEIDHYTAALRGVINPHGLDTEGPRAEFMAANGRKTFHRIGSRLGISPESSDRILTLAQARARQYGIPVQELA
jgi:hypothetical protein